MIGNADAMGGLTYDAVSRAEGLRRTFAHERPWTVGVEEEVMLLDADTLDLLPAAPMLIEAAGEDPRFKTELPAAQVEIVLPPATTVDEAAAALTAARGALATHAAEAGAVLAGGGVHPFTAGLGRLNGGARYGAIAEEFAAVARRQLVFGLHVHVALDGPDTALAVYNAFREHLPALAALAANSPYYEGADSGLASVRPKLNDLLPRQGIPPMLPTWDDVAGMHEWGRRTGAVPDAGQWWWEARLHPVHGTLEVRVCDTQAKVDDTAALVAIVHGLARLLTERHQADDLPAPAPTWRIDENRWSACRHGVRGRWFDVRDGSVRPTADHLHALLDDLHLLTSAQHLDRARRLIEHPRAEHARAVIQEDGTCSAMRWTADAFLS